MNRGNTSGGHFFSRSLVRRQGPGLPVSLPIIPSVPSATSPVEFSMRKSTGLSVRDSPENLVSLAILRNVLRVSMWVCTRIHQPRAPSPICRRKEGRFPCWPRSPCRGGRAGHPRSPAPAVASLDTAQEKAAALGLFPTPSCEACVQPSLCGWRLRECGPQGQSTLNSQWSPSSTTHWPCHRARPRNRSGLQRPNL